MCTLSGYPRSMDHEAGMRAVADYVRWFISQGDYKPGPPKPTLSRLRRDWSLNYLCVTEGYGGKSGCFITFGITRRSPEERYPSRASGLLRETLRKTKRRDKARWYEQKSLRLMREAFGPPDAGTEAWLWSAERQTKAVGIFDSVG